METKELMDLLRANQAEIVDELGVAHWTITYRSGSQPSDDEDWQNCGACKVNVAYDQALITLNPEAMEDEETVRKFLRHELFHVVLSPYRLLIEAVDKLISEDAKKSEMFGVLIRYAEEQAVVNLERMHRAMREKVRAAEKKLSDANALTGKAKAKPKGNRSGSRR